MSTTATAEVLKRVVPPLTVWILGKIVERPGVKRTLRRVDARLFRAAVEQRRRIPWRLVAGAGLIAAGAMLIVRGRRSPA